MLNDYLAVFVALNHEAAEDYGVMSVSASDSIIVMFVVS
jgi:hypothetical protein